MVLRTIKSAIKNSQFEIIFDIFETEIRQSEMLNPQSEILDHNHKSTIGFFYSDFVFYRKALKPEVGITEVFFS